MRKVIYILSLLFFSINVLANDWIDSFIEINSIREFYNVLDSNEVHTLSDPGGLGSFKVPRVFDMKFQNTGLSFERFFNFSLLRELDAYERTDVSKYTSSIIVTYDDRLVEKITTEFNKGKVCNGRLIEISPFIEEDFSSFTIRRKVGDESSFLIFLGISIEEIRYLLKLNDPCYLALFEEEFG